jgi:hypothetical protein
MIEIVGINVKNAVGGMKRGSHMKNKEIDNLTHPYRGVVK